MALAMAVKGSKRPSQTITWALEGGGVLDITGATITATIVNRETGVSRTSDGTFSVTSGPAGLFRWDYGAADVAEAGSHMVKFTAAFGSNPTPAQTPFEHWFIKE
jgi:hypothetical protein